MTKAIFTILVSMTFLVHLKGQESKELSVSVSAGFFNSPVYDNATSRGFFRIEMDHHLTSRHILGASYLAGQHYFYDNVVSNDPLGIFYKHGTYSTAVYRTALLMYKYKVIDNSKFSVISGVGAGTMTHTIEYPYIQETSFTNEQSSWTDLVFPVSLDFNYKISSRWQLGLTGGFFVHPDYPILALHTGPKLIFIVP